MTHEVKINEHTSTCTEGHVNATLFNLKAFAHRTLHEKDVVGFGRTLNIRTSRALTEVRTQGGKLLIILANELAFTFQWRPVQGIHSDHWTLVVLVRGKVLRLQGWHL